LICREDGDIGEVIKEGDGEMTVEMGYEFLVTSVPSIAFAECNRKTHLGEVKLGHLTSRCE